MAAAAAGRGVAHLPPLELETFDMDAPLELGPQARAAAPACVTAAERFGQPSAANPDTVLLALLPLPLLRRSPAAL
jgi:hypothetical protein